MADEIITNSAGECFVVFGKLLNNYDTGKNIGRLLIYINQKKMLELYQSTVPGGGIAFITKKTLILSHPNPNLVGKYLYMPVEIKNSDINSFQKLGKNTLLTSYPISDNPISGLTMVSFLDRDAIYRVTDNYIIISLLFLIFNIIFSLIATYFLSVRLSKSLNQLSERILHGESAMNINSNKSEIFILEQRFEGFVKEIDRLILQNHEIARQKQKAELAVLKAQINPHFIYNALDSISGMASVKKQPEIQKVCVALGRYFCLGLHCGNDCGLSFKSAPDKGTTVTIRIRKAPREKGIPTNFV